MLLWHCCTVSVHWVLRWQCCTVSVHWVYDGSVPLFQYVGSPVGYVQQVVVKSVVSPWQPQQMIPADAFRASLAKVFDVLHQLENFQQQTRSELAVCHFHSHLGHADCQLCFYII